MVKLLLAMSLALISGLVSSGDSLHGEVLNLQDEVLPPPVVPEPPIPAPSIPSVSDTFPAWPAQKKSARACRPRVIYRSHPLHRRRHLVRLPTEEVVLHVTDPVRCCVAEIPVCLPVCCGTPCVNSVSGVLGREVVSLAWDCGVRVKIVFRRTGDAIVHYYGI